MVEWSKSSILRSWMRKFVGSNPGEENRLSFVVLKNRMKEFDGICDTSRNKRRFESTFFDWWSHLTILFDINIVIEIRI